MNIAKGLKEKNKLTKTLNEKFQIIRNHNTFNVKNRDKVEYDVKEVITGIKTTIDQLVATKATIAKANNEVWDKIFLMAELKGFISALKQIPVKQGIEIENVGGYISGNKQEVEYASSITNAEIDVLVKNAEADIDVLQNDLDTFNFTTEVEI